MLVSTVELLTRARRGKSLGLIGTENLKLDWPAVIARKDDIVARWSKGKNATPAKLGIPVLTGRGVFAGRNEINVSGRNYSADKFVIATGSKPARPAIPGAEIDEWLYGTGMPATTPAIPSGVFDAVDRAAVEWRAGRLPVDQLPVRDWLPQEWVRFLDRQPAELEDAKLAELRAQFHLGADGNAEIARSWLALVVRTAFEPAYLDLERYLLSTGRYKLVVGLYRDLARTETGLELGRDAIPDETTILNFRHLLERHDLTKAIFAAVAEHLAAKGELLRAARFLFSGQLKPVIDRTFPLADAAAAQRRLEGSGQFGKIVLEV